MKQAVIFISFFLAIASESFISSEKQHRPLGDKFHLNFVTIGLGSNIFELSPIFRVDGMKFIYTSEEVWTYRGQSKIQKDTLLTGNFRISSIDSILNLIGETKDAVIYRTNIHIRSGSASYITIEDGLKKTAFHLHNASDPTADKIVAILNTYIPKPLDKLHICCGPASPD